MSLTHEGSVLNFFLIGITANASTSYLRVTMLRLQRLRKSPVFLFMYLFIYLFYLLTYLFIYLFVCFFTLYLYLFKTPI